jgi:hypothetical protein
VFTPIVSSLVYLYLEDNLLETLPGDVFNGLSKVTRLYLEDNRLTVLQPNQFVDLNALETLKLNGNAFEVLAAGVFDACTALQELWLNNNKLTALDKHLFNQLTQLQTLLLDFNPLSDLNVQIFTNQTQLSHLEMTETALTRLPAGMFDTTTALALLFLSGSSIAALDVDIFAQLTGLRVLELQNNAITEVHAALFTANTQLRILWLHRNAIPTLAEGLFANQPYIYDLDLSGNLLTTIDASIFAPLVDSLDSLSIVQNNIQRIDAVVAEFSLATLSMDGNPSTCWLVTATADSTDKLVCECAEGFARSTNRLCGSVSSFVIVPTFASLRGTFVIQGTDNQLAAQTNQSNLAVEFFWNRYVISSPTDVAVSLVWEAGSNSRATFSPFYGTNGADWDAFCSSAACEKANLTDTTNVGMDLVWTAALIDCNVVGTNGVTTVTKSINIVYSAFYHRERFDAVVNTVNATVITTAGWDQQPRRIRIQEEVSGAVAAPAPLAVSTAGVISTVQDWLHAPAIVSTNPAIPTSVSFQLDHSTCSPPTGVAVQREFDAFSGELLGWELVVGGNTKQAGSMAPCTATVQAVDSITNEMLDVVMIQASVHDCFDGEDAVDVDHASRSCHGRGQCIPDTTPYDGVFMGCICDAGYTGARCEQAMIECAADEQGRKMVDVQGKCKAFVLETADSGARNVQAGFEYTDPILFAGPYIVGSTYRIAALTIDAAATNVSAGTLASITYTLSASAPAGFFVASTTGDVLAQFDAPGDYSVTLIAVDASGLDATVETIEFRVVPRAQFTLAVVALSRTQTGAEFTNPDELNTEYWVGQSYRIAPRVIDQELTNVSVGSITQIRYTLQDAPPSWFVSASTGEVFGYFNLPGSFSFTLVASDAGNQAQTVETLTFDVIEPELFATKSIWTPDTMMTDQILPTYALGHTFSIKGPSLTGSDLFEHASSNDYSSTAITFSVDCHVALATVVAESEKQSAPACPQFFVDTGTGAMLVTMSVVGQFNATLMAKDAAGRSTQVKMWDYSIQMVDTATPTNGPNGVGCGLGSELDLLPFDNMYTCDCTGTGLVGDNCAIDPMQASKAEAARAAATTTNVAYVFGLIVVALLLAFGANKYRLYGVRSFRQNAVAR